MKKFLQRNKFFVTVVTLYDIFIQDIKDFLAFKLFEKIGFSLKNKIYTYFFAGFCFYLLANSR